jgi:hypothetical protein
MKNNNIRITLGWGEVHHLQFLIVFSKFISIPWQFCDGGFKN